jgi:hypothetical protein
MAFHIVTSRCFLTCEKIISITIQEERPETDYSIKPIKAAKSKAKVKKAKVPDKKFEIKIVYYPLAVGGSHGIHNTSEPTEYTLDITSLDEKTAHTLYGEIVREVQEQHPHEGYLDKLVSKLFENETELAVDEPKPKED